MIQTNFLFFTFPLLDDLQGNVVQSALKVTATAAAHRPVCIWVTLALLRLWTAGGTSWRSRDFVLHEALNSGPVPGPWSWDKLEIEVFCISKQVVLLFHFYLQSRRPLVLFFS